MQWRRQFRKCRDGQPQKPDKSQEHADFLDVGRRKPLGDCLNLARIGAQLPLSYEISEEGHGGAKEVALGELNVDAVGFERRENERPHCLVNVVGTLKLGRATALEGYGMLRRVQAHERGANVGVNIFVDAIRAQQ